MRKWFVFAGVFVLALVVQTPASVFLPSALRGAGISVDGSVWDAALTYTGPDGLPVEASLSLSPLSLLTGNVAAELQASSLTQKINGQLSAPLFGGGLQLNHTQIQQDLSAMRLPAGFIGRMTLNIDTLTLSSSFACQSAKGTARTDALQVSLKGRGFDAPILAGPIGCAGGMFTAQLEGTLESAHYSLSLITPTAPKQAHAGVQEDVRPHAILKIQDPELTLAFALTDYGFENKDGLFTLDLSSYLPH